MNNIGNFSANFFMASLAASAGNSLEAGGVGLSFSASVPGGFQTAVHLEPQITVRTDFIPSSPLFRPRKDYHKRVPLELLVAGGNRTFQEGARVYLEPSLPPGACPERSRRRGGLGWGEDAVAGDVRLATSGEGEQTDFVSLLQRALWAGSRVWGELKDVRRDAVSALKAIPLCLDPKDHLRFALTIEKRLVDESQGVRSAAVEVLREITPYLKPRDRLRLAITVEQRLEEEEGNVRRAAVNALRIIIPHLEPKDRLARALAVEGRLTDEKSSVRSDAVWTLREITQFLEPQDRLARALAVEQRMVGTEAIDVRNIAVEALGRIALHMESKDRVSLALAVEKRLVNEDKSVRIAAVEALGKIIQHLERKDRLLRTLAVEQRLEDEEDEEIDVRSVAVKALGEINPHLEPKDRLARALVVEPRLADGMGKVRWAAAKALGVISQGMESKDRLRLVVAVESRLGGKEEVYVRWDIAEALKNICFYLVSDKNAARKALATLCDPLADGKKKEEAVVIFAYAQGNHLSPGARSLLRLLGKRMLEGEVGSLEVFAPRAGERRRLRGMAERLEELARNFREREGLLKGYPTVGGKIRGSAEKTQWGYRSGPTALIDGEEEPILLEPVRDPMLLVQTVEDLVFLDRSADDRGFHFSLTLSGQVGDDLKPAALGVHALLKNPYPFPNWIGSDARFTWFAPVVEGGGNFDALNGEKETYANPKTDKRYDHLFLRFELPPTLERFKKGTTDARWMTARKEFLETLKPAVRKVDRKNRNIQIYLKGLDEHFLWFPAKSEWETMTRRDLRGRVEIHPATFETLFFLEFARRALREELMEVVEAAWVLGMLREVKRNGEGTMGENLLQKLNRFALRELAGHYETEMSRLLNGNGLGSVLETPWVGNEDWASIRDDMRGYQRMLENEEFRKAVQGLVRTTVEEAKGILFP